MEVGVKAGADLVGLGLVGFLLGLGLWRLCEDVLRFQGMNLVGFGLVGRGVMESENTGGEEVVLILLLQDSQQSLL